MRLLWLATLLLGVAAGSGVSPEEVSPVVSPAAHHDVTVEQRDVTRTQAAAEEKSDAKLLFPVVYSSTITVFSIQSVTSTIPFTCFNVLTGTTTACTGRRRRRRSGHLSKPRALQAPVADGAATELLGSLSEDGIAAAKTESSRLLLTSWITVVSSVTSVSTVTKYDTTVSLGLLCSIGGTPFFSTCP